MNRSVHFVLDAILLMLFSSSAAFAGTGQIFSPSGLPQGSTQSYSPPTPGNTPTVTFPTPPLPLGEGVLQGFPGAAVPLAGTDQGTSTASTSTNQPIARPTEGSVQSFFQCPPATAQKKKTASPVKSVGRFAWHVLDNIGVPLSVSKDNDLDPSLIQPYVMPLSKTSTQMSSPPIPQKIPESELEGTDVSPAQDNQPVRLH